MRAPFLEEGHDSVKGIEVEMISLIESRLGFERTSLLTENIATDGWHQEVVEYVVVS